MADRYENLVIDALKAAGAVLVRQRVHAVWRFPDGTCWTVPQTASDRRAWQNAWGQLRVKLGLNDPDRGTEGERRSKPNTVPQGPSKPVKLTSVPPPPSLQQKLKRVKLGFPKEPKVVGPQREPIDVSGLMAKWAANKIHP